MFPFYIFILITFVNSSDYKVIDIESYKYTHYAKDIIQSKDDAVIYRFVPKTEEGNIFLLFLGYPKDDSFEFYLYKELSDIKLDDNAHFLNYIEKYDIYEEYNINQTLDEYYILVRMNSYEENYDYLNFILYNTKEHWDIGSFDLTEEYVMAFEQDKEIILTYPLKDITQQLYINTKGECDEITYTLYNNDTGETVKSINDNCFKNQNQNIAFVRGSSYYLKISFKKSSTNKIFRLVLYFLTNKKNIKEINDYRTSLKFGYTSIPDKLLDVKYFFINATNLPGDQYIGYSVIDPFNPVKYKYYIKGYANYDINEIQDVVSIQDYDYELYNYVNIDKHPLISINRYKNVKGYLLEIVSKSNENDDIVDHNEMIVYLNFKAVNYLSQNEIFNSEDLSQKNVFDLEHMKRKFIMKSNLDYFIMLYPKREKIYSKTYLFQTNEMVFELPNCENASVEFQYVKEDNIITNLASPNLWFLCKDNTYEEKIMYLPYMTDFHYLFGDIKVYDIDVTLLKSLDQFYDEQYMQIYDPLKRYYDYSSQKEQKFFYKLKCNKYSLLKLENSFESYLDENIIVNESSKKLILDFKKYDKKNITFQSNINLSIGIIDSPEFNWNLNFYINDEKFSLNNQNDTLFKEFNTNDILIIENPEQNIHPFIKVIYNYPIEKVRPTSTGNSGIFVFDKNITEEYDIYLNITLNYMSPTYGKYSLFYGNPQNYEYNELIRFPIQITNNPYKYLEKEEENKFFYVLYHNDEKINPDELHFIKLSRTDIKLNTLTLIEKGENENLKIYLPKINKNLYAFIQFFDEHLYVYENGKRRSPKNYYDEYNFYYYTFYDGEELYADNNSTKAYKSLFYVSYLDEGYYDDIKEIYNYGCVLKIHNIADTKDNIVINMYNYVSHNFHYYIFIVSNSTANASYYNQKTPMELYYEKDKNSLKYYEVNEKEEDDEYILEISDTFVKGPMNITIVGQDSKGFRAFVYAREEYIYIGNPKSYLTYIIIGSIAGAIVLIIIICVIYSKVKKNKKRKEEEYFKKQNEKILLNQLEEKEKEKKYENSADFNPEINGDGDTSQPM